jgi:O-antigen ligase
MNLPLITNHQSRLTFYGHITLLLSAFFAAINISATDIFMTITALLSIVSGQFFKAWPQIRRNPIFIASLLFFILITAGLFWSIAPWHERMSSFHKYSKLLYIPFLIPFCIDPVWRRRMLNAFLLAMGITVLLSFLKQFAGLQIGGEDLPSWVFFGHIETSFFVAFACYVFAQRTIFESRQRWINAALCLIFSLQEFLLNDSRTGWMTYFGLLFLLFIQVAIYLVHKKYPNNPRALFKIGFRWMIYAGLIIGALFYASYSVSTSFRDNVEEATRALNRAIHRDLPKDDLHYVSSSEFRLLFIQLSLDLAKQQPVFGLGTGSFPEAYRRSPGIPAWWDDNLNNPHNEYLLALVQFGITGVLLLLYFFFTQWRATFFLKKEIFVAQALVFSFAVGCFYNSFLYLSNTGHFYIIFSTVLLGQYFALQCSKTLPTAETCKV